MTFRFVCELPVRYADTDAQGHVFFANYFTYCDEALTAYLRSAGMAWKDVLALGVDMFYVSAHCDYRGSARFEDTVVVGVRVERIGTTSLETAYELRNGRGGEIIATARLVNVCVAKESREKMPVPEPLRAAIAAVEKW